MSGTGSWLQFANRMNKFKGSYFQDFADISGDIIVRNTGNVYLHAGSNMYMTAGDISMNGYIYCKGVVDLSGNSLSGGGDGGGLGGLDRIKPKHACCLAPECLDLLRRDGDEFERWRPR